MRKVTASSIEDLIVLVPHVIGFHPSDSLVVLTFGGEHCPHFRVDMPHDLKWCTALVQQIVTSGAMTYAPAAAILGYTEDRANFQTAVTMFREAFSDVTFVDAARVHKGRFWRLPEHPDDLGTPYDADTNPLTCEMALDGSAPLASREALHLPERASEELATLVGREAQRAFRAMEAAGHNRYVREQQDWVLERLPSRRPLSDEELARFVVAAEQYPVRDVAWTLMDAEHRREWKDFWHDAASRTCELTASVPALFAFASWFAGDGASAWIGVDRAHQIEENYSMADRVQECLMRAVAPHAWSPLPVAELLVEA